MWIPGMIKTRDFLFLFLFFLGKCGWAAAKTSCYDLFFLHFQCRWTKTSLARRHYCLMTCGRTIEQKDVCFLTTVRKSIVMVCVFNLWWLLGKESGCQSRIRLAGSLPCCDGGFSKSLSVVKQRTSEDLPSCLQKR